MDVLSDAVAAMRTGLPHSSLVAYRGPFGVRFPPGRGAGFHVVLRGACRLRMTGGGPAVTLNAGDVALLPREFGHSIADCETTPLVDAEDLRRRVRAREPADGPVTLLLCGAYSLDHTRPHPLFAELPEVVHLPASPEANPELRGAIDLLGRELSGDALPGANGVVPALLDVLLLYMLRAWYADRGGPGATGWAAALHDPPVAAALRAIHSAPAEPWTVQRLAAEGGVSRSTFAQRFAAAVGMPPLGYLTWWRMTRAAMLLRDTDLPARSVAGRVGYASEYAFAKAFKRETGLAPGRFRHGGAEDEAA